ncbi:MAG: stage II sporulation protein M [Anaerovoracaceae bacterium]
MIGTRVKKEIKDTFGYIRKNLLKRTAIVGLVFVALAILSGIGFYNNPEQSGELLKSLSEEMSDVVKEDGTISLVGLFANNLFACAVSIGLGVIPLLFLPAFSILANSIVIGALLGYGEATSTMVAWKSVVFGMLPHGIFELTAMFMSATMGLYLCKIITLKILGKGNEGIWNTINEMVRAFVLVLIPLLIIAAVVECYLTPLIIGVTGL